MSQTWSEDGYGQYVVTFAELIFHMSFKIDLHKTTELKKRKQMQERFLMLIFYCFFCPVAKRNAEDADEKYPAYLDRFECQCRPFSGVYWLELFVMFPQNRSAYVYCVTQNNV